MISFPAAVLAIFLLGAFPAAAQTPAQPADPNQPIPAQPAVPVIVTPAAAPPAPVGAMPVAIGPAISIVADSSLKAVLQELAQTWADSQPASPQMPITLTNAGTMRLKIEAGAAWDLALDADLDDVKEMTDRGFLLAAGQRSLARNSLVVYGRAPLVKDDELDWFDLIGTEWKKIALGNPSLVASGRAAQRALHAHDLDDDGHRNLFVPAANEAAALQLLQRQRADAAFVYRTDLAAVALPNFTSYPVKSDEAPPIFYSAAIFRLAKNPLPARQFLDYLGSADARVIWAKYGFETD